MLPDFLKGNHFTIKLATAPWLWETKGYLDDHQEWNTPVGGETRGAFVIHARGRGSSDVGAQCISSQDLSRLIQLERAQVRFPGSRRSCDSASERLRTGSQVGRRRLSVSVDLGETMQEVPGYWQRRDRGRRGRTVAGRASTSTAVDNRRQIGFSDPWRERFGSGGAHASLFSIFFKKRSARLCVQQVRCRFDSLAATTSLNC
jgi:hypothetical protein